MLYRVLKDGTKYLKPSKRWHFDIRNANGAVRRVNEPGGTRTLDQRINLPHSANCNPISNQQLTQNASAGCSAQQSEGGISDPDVLSIAEAWPTLPAPIRAAIRAMIQAAKAQP